MLNIRSCLVCWLVRMTEEGGGKCQNEIKSFILASLLLQHSDEICKRKICQCSVWIYFTLEIYLCRLYTVLGLLFHPWILHVNSYILQSLWSLKEILTSKNLQSSQWCLPPPRSLYFSLFSRSDSHLSGRCWLDQMIWREEIIFMNLIISSRSSRNRKNSNLSELLIIRKTAELLLVHTNSWYL